MKACLGKGRGSETTTGRIRKPVRFAGQTESGLRQGTILVSIEVDRHRVVAGRQVGKHPSKNRICRGETSGANRSCAIGEMLWIVKQGTVNNPPWVDNAFNDHGQRMSDGVRGSVRSLRWRCEARGRVHASARRFRWFNRWVLPRLRYRRSATGETNPHAAPDGMDRSTHSHRHATRGCKASKKS